MRKLLVAFSFCVVFFLTQWLTQAAAVVAFPSPGAPAAFYSNQTGTDLRLFFCEALSSAKSSIFLEVYSITDPHILTVLSQKSKEFKIEIIADAKASPGLHKKLGKTVELSLHRDKGLMHRKVVVIDDELVLLGSTNFTSASLQMHDNLVIAIQEKALAAFLKNPELSSAAFSFSEQDIAIWKLPDSGEAAYQSIYQTLQTAKKTIRVAMFTFTHPHLAGELIAAKERGVDVQVTIDHYTVEGSSKKIAHLLRTHGIPVFSGQGMQLMHHKWALIDDETLLTGSTNWTKSAFLRNKEIAMTISPLTPEQKNQINRIWRILRLSTN